MINYLSLQNFKKHEKITVRFGAGLQLITGNNYAGKTTILHGILYCLGGASQVPGTDIQRRGTNSGFRQEMGFTVDGQQYIVIRTKTSAKLYKGNTSGEILCSGTTAVNQRIEQMLGLSLRRFRQLRYAEQKRTDSILTYGASELSQIIEELSGVEKIDTALERLKSDISHGTGKLEGLQFKDTTEDQERLKRMTLDSMLSEESVRGLEDMLEHTTEELTDTTNAVRNLQRKEKAFKDWESSHATQNYLVGKYRNDRDAAQEDVNALPKLAGEEELNQRYQKADDQLRSSRKYQRDVSRTETVYNTEKETLAEHRKCLQEFIIPKKPTKKLLTDQERKVSSFQQQISDSKARLNVVETQLENGFCGECGSKLAEELNRAEAEAEISQLKIALKELRASLKNDQAKLKLMQDQVRDHETARENKKAEEQRVIKSEIRATGFSGDLFNAKESLETTLSGSTLEQLEQEADKLSQQVADLQRQQRESAKKQKALTQCQKHFEEAEQELETLNSKKPDFSPEALTNLQSQQEELQDRRDDHAKRLGTAKVQYSNIAVRLDALKESLEKQEADNEVHIETTKRLNNCKALQKYLRENRNRYMSDAWAVFMAQASRFVSNCTGGAISGMDRTEDGKFTFNESGNAMHMKSASGAQSSIMGLGIQLALADSAACGLDILLCDEPASDMDDEHSMALSALLAAEGRQVLCISHNRMDTSVCSNVLAV